MRERCLKTVYALAQQDPRVVFIGSDLGVGVLDEFKKNIPERFFMEGVAEQNLVGVAAGLAMNGHVVYLNTIATFLSRRCFEQIAVDLCLHNVNVRLIANGGGVVYAPLGPTHLAIEDIAICRALPNMTVVAPADEVEMIRFVKASVDHQGPIYIRVAKGHDPIVTTDTGPFVIGKAVPMREGSDALVITTGVTLQLGLAAADKLAATGVSATVLHFPTVKPLDVKALHEYAERATAIVTVEEHTVIGGLGSACAEYLAETDLLASRRFKRIGFNDVFPSIYGDQNNMMRHYGISADSVVETVNALLAARPKKSIRVAA
jgi:transketolase